MGGGGGGGQKNKNRIICKLPMPAAAPAPNSLFHALVYELKMGFGDAKGQHLIYEQIFCPVCTLVSTFGGMSKTVSFFDFFVRFIFTEHCACAKIRGLTKICVFAKIFGKIRPNISIFRI
jgi:hypothetical protein